MGFLWSVAVGEHGRWFKRERDDSGALGLWREQPAIGDVALKQVSVAGAGAVITGAGQIQAAVGTQREIYSCTPAKPLSGFILLEGFQGVAYAVTSAGEVLQFGPVSTQRHEPYCAYLQLPMGSVIATGLVPCDGAPLPRALTDRGLFGANVCVRVI